MEADLNKYNGNISATGKTMLYFFAFHINFSVEDFENAYAYLNKIKQHETESNRTDIFDCCNILLPIAAYESGRYDLLKKDLKKLYSHLLKKEEKTAFENYVFKAIKQLPKYKESAKWFKACNQQLQLLKEDTHFTNAFDHFKVTEWLACKLLNKSYGQQILAKAVVG